MAAVFYQLSRFLFEFEGQSIWPQLVHSRMWFDTDLVSHHALLKLSSRHVILDCVAVFLL